jgi:hypothetical protein
MNVSLVKTVPQGEFEEVSVLKDGWRDKFQSLVSRNRPLKFDMYPKKGIPEEVKAILEQRGYNALVPLNDRWQHFLLPPAC